MTTRTLSTEARKSALDDCENKIRAAYKKGLAATCEIAKELAKIKREELFYDVTPDFMLYVIDHLAISERAYRQIMSVGETVAQLQNAGAVVPAHESHVIELARLEPPLRLKVWNDLLNRFEYEEQTMTADDIKEAVQAAVKAVEVRQAARQKKAEIEIEMDDEDKDRSRAAARDPEADVLFSEKGEAALSKIAKLCGEGTADAIRRGNPIALSERELHLWAEQEDNMIRMISSLVNEQWSVSKALAYLSEPLGDETSVYRLFLIAYNNGGIAVINYQDKAKITVELTK